MAKTDRLRIDFEADTPIVVQLTEQLTWLIASGMIEAGETLPPIRLLAADLGVHMHTVREAYHRLEASQLVSIRPRAGTTVLPFDAAAFSEKQDKIRSFLIGVLIPAPAAIYVPFIRGIQAASARYGWMPLFAFTQDNPFLTERYAHQLIAKQVDGLIVTSPGEIERFNRMLHSEHFPPIVYADAPHIDRNSVSPDSEEAAYSATQHLLEHGYTRIGLITAPLDWENVAPCFAGYRRALIDADLKPDPDFIQETLDFQPSSGHDAALELMKLETPPEAFFVTADDLAFGVLEALAGMELRVPEDVTIASYGDVEGASNTLPSLTTAKIPAFKMGFEAVQSLQALFSGEVETLPPKVLECPLVIRASCGCNPAVQHQKE